MDSRRIFLHHVPPELWGHGRIARAGNEKTGASGVGGGMANPSLNPKT